jgi:hypothetical protein
MMQSPWQKGFSTLGSVSSINRYTVMNFYSRARKRPIPPRLSLFRKRKRVRAAMLATKRRRFWFVMSVGWIALWICFFASNT